MGERGKAAVVERHASDSGCLMCLYILSLVQYKDASELSVRFRRHINAACGHYILPCTANSLL